MVRSFELINDASQAVDASPLTNATSAIEETYDGGPQESGSIRFETTIECHVALDVHAILQKWDSYQFVSTRLPGNLDEKVLRSLIFTVRNDSAKTAKIMHLENLALYGRNSKSVYNLAGDVLITTEKKLVTLTMCILVAIHTPKNRHKKVQYVHNLFQLRTFKAKDT